MQPSTYKHGSELLISGSLKLFGVLATSFLPPGPSQRDFVAQASPASMLVASLLMHHMPSSTVLNNLRFKPLLGYIIPSFEDCIRNVVQIAFRELMVVTELIYPGDLLGNAERF